MTSVSSTTSSAATTGTTSASTASAASSAIKSYASTSATSVDWSGLIEADYESKLTGVSTYQTKISTNEAKISAYSNAQSLLQTLESAANALREPSDSLNQADDVFRTRTATLTAVGDVTPSAVVSVTSDNDADTGSHSLTVSQLAQVEKIASSSQSSSSTALNLSGTLTLGASDGKSTSISVTSSMTLSDLASAINNKTSTSGIQASVLKVSDSSYELVVATKDTDQTISLTDPSGIFTSLGLTGSDGSYTDELQKSQAAEFTLDGVSMTRSSNTITDALDGSTLNLTGTTASDTSVTIQVSPDTTGITTAVNTFVTAYNAYRDWALTQQGTNSDGSASSNAVLFGDSTISQINSSITNALNYSIGGTSLATVGLSFDSNNKLTVNSTTLANAISNNLSDVQSLFGYTFNSSSSDLRILDRGSNAPASYTLNISADSSGNVSGVSVDGDDTLFSVDGSTITGVAGSAFDGYTFVYTGSGNQTVTVNQTSGIADQIYNASDAASNSTDGSLQTLQTSLTSEDTDYNTQISNIETRAQTYKDSITSSYAQIQASISTASSNLSYLSALVSQSSSS
jgi:flagellar hook-associated protein 2